MNLKCKLAIYAIISLLCLSFLAQTPTQAFSSASFNTDTGKEYIWEVVQINVTYYSNPYLTQVGDRLKLVIIIANTTEIGDVTYDMVCAMLYYNTAANRTWLFAGPVIPCPLAIFNGTYFDCFDFPYLIPLNKSIAWDWMKEEWLQYDFKGAHHTTSKNKIESIFYTYETPAYDTSNLYEDFIYRNGVLLECRYFIANGTARNLHTSIARVESGGVPGFPTLPVLLILCGFLAVYTLLSKKKLEISI